MVVYLIFVVVILFVLVVLGGKLFLGQDTGLEGGKTVMYECSFKDMNMCDYSTYTMQFFLIGISFMLFDLEIVIIIPMVGIIPQAGVVILCFLIFLLVVSLALGYELLFIMLGGWEV